MNSDQRPLKVLHSFPHRLGKARICTTAWYEIDSTAAAGAEMLVYAGDSVRPFRHQVRVKTTLSFGRLRIPYRVLGTMKACALHDWLVARQLPKIAHQIDIIHAWPLAAYNTIKVANKFGIPVALERCNAHTRYAYEVVRNECERLGVPLPSNHEHAYNAKILQREEKEYQLADAILCPSDFVEQTFLNYGFTKEKIARHQYGFDEKIYYPDNRKKTENDVITMLFVGGCAPRKGLHYALEAWLNSPACKYGTFMVAGDFVPGYAEKLSSMLADPSVKVLGHRNDVPDLMRKSDILVLPSIEEGSALVTSEGRGCGCVLLVSEAAGAICNHMENALVHSVGDVKTLTDHITMLHEDNALLEKLRTASLNTTQEINWTAAGQKLMSTYKIIVKEFENNSF